MANTVKEAEGTGQTQLPLRQRFSSCRVHRTRLGDLVECRFWLRSSARLTLSRGLWPPLGPPSVSTDSSSRTGVGSWGQPWNQTARSPVQVAQVSLSLLPARRPRRDTGPGHRSHPSGCLCFSRIHHVESGRQQGGVRRGESRGGRGLPTARSDVEWETPPPGCQPGKP